MWLVLANQQQIHKPRHTLSLCSFTTLSDQRRTAQCNYIDRPTNLPHLPPKARRHLTLVATKMGPPWPWLHAPPILEWTPKKWGLRGNCNAFSSKLISLFAIPSIYHENTEFLAMRHAIYSALHCHHIQRDVLRFIAKPIHQSPSPIHFYKVKSYADIIVNEYADALARKSFTTYSDVADTSIKTAGPEGNPSYNIYWLAKKYEEHRIIQNNPNTAQSPISRLWYLSNYHDALQAHMHPLRKLEMPIL